MPEKMAKKGDVRANFFGTCVPIHWNTTQQYAKIGSPTYAQLKRDCGGGKDARAFSKIGKPSFDEAGPGYFCWGGRLIAIVVVMMSYGSRLFWPCSKEPVNEAHGTLNGSHRVLRNGTRDTLDEAGQIGRAHV